MELSGHAYISLRNSRVRRDVDGKIVKDERGDVVHDHVGTVDGVRRLVNSDRVMDYTTAIHVDASGGAQLVCAVPKISDSVKDDHDALVKFVEAVWFDDKTAL